MRSRWVVTLVFGATLFALALAAAAGLVTRRLAAAWTDRWPTVAAAVDAGERERGWIPNDVPSEATDLVTWRDVDGSTICGVFSLPPLPGLAQPPKLPLAKPEWPCSRLNDPRVARLSGAPVVAMACGSEAMVTVIDRASGVGGFWTVHGGCTHAGR